MTTTNKKQTITKVSTILKLIKKEKELTKSEINKIVKYLGSLSEQAYETSLDIVMAIFQNRDEPDIYTALFQHGKQAAVRALKQVYSTWHYVPTTFLHSLADYTVDEKILETILHAQAAENDFSAWEVKIQTTHRINDHRQIIARITPFIAMVSSNHYTQDHFRIITKYFPSPLEMRKLCGDEMFTNVLLSTTKNRESIQYLFDRYGSSAVRDDFENVLKYDKATNPLHCAVAPQQIEYLMNEMKIGAKLIKHCLLHRDQSGNTPVQYYFDHRLYDMIEYISSTFTDEFWKATSMYGFHNTSVIQHVLPNIKLYTLFRTLCRKSNQGAMLKRLLAHDAYGGKSPLVQLLYKYVDAYDHDAQSQLEPFIQMFCEDVNMNADILRSLIEQRCPMREGHYDIVHEKHIQNIIRFVDLVLKYSNVTLTELLKEPMCTKVYYPLLKRQKTDFEHVAKSVPVIIQTLANKAQVPTHLLETIIRPTIPHTVKEFFTEKNIEKSIHKYYTMKNKIK